MVISEFISFYQWILGSYLTHYLLLLRRFTLLVVTGAETEFCQVNWGEDDHVKMLRGNYEECFKPEIYSNL